MSVSGTTLTIDPAEYFFRKSDRPEWTLVDWDLVVEKLLEVSETDEVAVEQQALDFVRAYGQRTTDPTAVLKTADRVYGYLFDESRLGNAAPDGVTANDLRILRESATIAALNRVHLTGDIEDIGPAWFFAATAQTVYDLDEAAAERIDDLY
nr:hypothetical protein [Micromonospora sp. DSM 115978]